MRLTPSVHLVGSGSGGFDLTDPFDCHVYLVDGGSEAALVDAGIGSGMEAILANVREAGVDADRLRWLFLTHAHADHAGGAARLRELVPEIRIVASPSAARWVREGDEDAMSLEVGKRAEFYPADFRFPACPVDVELSEGERVRVGAVELEAVETPGHADGHLSFRARIDDMTVLFSGDLVFSGGQISLEANWDCRLHDYRASLAKLAGTGIDALLPGHGLVTLQEGQRHVDTANRLFSRGFVPKSVV